MPACAAYPAFQGIPYGSCSSATTERCLLLSQPIVRFDSIGTVRHVLRDAETHVPAVFGVRGAEILGPLKRFVLQAAPENPWTLIVLSLSMGMARRELDEISSHEFRHDGPILVEPDVEVRQYNSYATINLLRHDTDRLAGDNEDTYGIFAVLYAINNYQQGHDNLRFAVRRVRMATQTLQQIMEEDEALRHLYRHALLDGELVRRLLHLHDALGGLTERVRNNASSNYYPTLQADINLAMAALAAMQGESPFVDISLQGLIHQLGRVPEEFAGITSWTPHHQARLYDSLPHPVQQVARHDYGMAHAPGAFLPAPAPRE